MLNLKLKRLTNSRDETFESIILCATASGTSDWELQADLASADEAIGYLLAITPFGNKQVFDYNDPMEFFNEWDDDFLVWEGSLYARPGANAFDIDIAEFRKLVIERLNDLLLWVFVRRVGAASGR